ncbi:hypothetical protein C731_3147 [Mycolicibacterium hassiacum DSM 44199]|jgi:hypothetical protein|uniref:Uncharacterized protein n=2 Tax=Mycolicibacterium hassiacum TaxID=46351 RepID=K5BF61_MYCHD|nr:DUF732 domain-containing protein [Mycolicibacterium hassiacum]EKF22866.1 hypothetical protein C731_3147 [Mycolicibacterium hassiacum DSM 44199]MBX5486953.1 DUF732 domain-containing protein [Mycolicibacterium hassiacum]MDA4087326.1 hypothetical protein [Mycolicibacterium hassiacum DSM 44199]VCT91041.1 hypothetical protein MHAS_02755 [Mycolicibacterium hassiacum DSM 44199]
MGRSFLRSAVLATGTAVTLAVAPLPAAGAQPTPEFCVAMQGAGFDTDCTTLIGLGKQVCTAYDRGASWASVADALDARTGDETLSNFVIAGAPMYLCPQHADKNP